MKLKNSQYINQNSGDVEKYTPAKVIRLVLRVLKRIDLDPASCARANEVVKARTYFTKDDTVSSLRKNWFGKVWMNHPFSRMNNKIWIKKLVYEYEKGNVEEACCITFANTSEKWFRPLHNYTQCYFYERTNYLDHKGRATTDAPKGSVLTYLGVNISLFAEVFCEVGSIKISI